MNSQYTITDRLKPADIDAIQALLKDTYWASERTRGEVEESLRHSVIVVARGPDRQLVGCARAVTDTCTFAWICDVVVAPGHRRRGLGKALVERLLAHPAVTRTRKVLVTKDAQGLYRKFGFERHPFECMIKYPEKPRPAHYSASAGAGVTSETSSIPCTRDSGQTPCSRRHRANRPT